MSHIRLAVLGLGNMGTGHINNILSGKTPEITLAAACDIDPAARERIERLICPAKSGYGLTSPTANLQDEKCPNIPIYATAEEMFAAGGFDALLIAVPHYDHPRYAIEAIRRGIHVMVEKPAGVYTKQAREMNDFAAAHPNTVFGMMFNQRTIPLYRKMKELVSGGELGALKRTSWIITDWYRTQSYYDSGAWRATWSGEGGGVLLNQCPHNLDLFQWICGLPIKVDAHLHFGKWHDIEVEDDVTAYLEYENGATGTFVTTTADAPGTNRFELTFEGGKLLAEDGRLTLWKNAQNEREYCRTSRDAYSPPKCEKIEIPTPGEATLHSGVLNAFSGAILRGEPLVARGEEGIRALTLSNAMHLSAFLGKPVEIPFDEELYLAELNKRIAVSRGKGSVIPRKEVGKSYYM